MRTSQVPSVLLAGSLGMGLGQSAWAQDAAPAAKDEAASIDEIIVTARRVEERLQDVPISITVLTEEDLSNNNIQSAKDIATYTPGLTTNNRYGSDNTTWTIRGFTQEQRTTSTVGTYFADVVAPRGSGATQGGDGAGPGSLFDLQNVQVLKGPQGTLFGRNSTGGAVLLVPRKPTPDLEGYLEASAGDYGMYRGQGVLNVPFGDSFRVRLGVDHNQRDGYLKNAGRIGTGPNGDDMGSAEYLALRLSAVADLSANLENYTVATYSETESTGTPPKIVKCYPDTAAATTAGHDCTATAGSPANANGLAAQAQVAREAPFGFWSVSNSMVDALSETEQWQVINVTTWQANDALTVKNILSYGEFRGDTNLDLFGFYAPIVTPGTETNGNEVKPFASTHLLPDHHTNAQSSLVEELQLQGRTADGRFSWQGGLYFEANDPLGLSGVQTATLTPCADVSSFNCVPLTNGVNSLGRLSYSTTKTSFQGKAAYFQAGYDLTDQLKLTGGIRYTEDRVRSEFQVNAITITTNPPGNNVVCTNTPTFGAAGSATNPRLPLDQRFTACQQTHTVENVGADLADRPGLQADRGCPALRKMVAWLSPGRRRRLRGGQAAGLRRGAGRYLRSGREDQLAWCSAGLFQYLRLLQRLCRPAAADRSAMHSDCAVLPDDCDPQRGQISAAGFRSRDRNFIVRGPAAGSVLCLSRYGGQGDRGRDTPDRGSRFALQRH